MMQYWVVGAMFGGSKDQLPTFLDRGYWYCWDLKKHEEIPPAVEKKFIQIQKGDRIAVKKLVGIGSTEIEIRALGIVKDIDQSEWRIYVDWVLSGLERRVPLHGCAASIHGPFQADDPWVREVFQL